MSTWTPQQKKLVRVLLLGVILVIALLIASIPRWTYAYPIHSDEWSHYADTQSLMDTGKLSFPAPNEAGVTFSPDTEIGFHLFLGEFKHITGLSWLDMFRFIPGIILVILAFQVYSMTRKKWVGLLSAFLTVLIPTTIRFLGPAFLVPVALALVFIPFTLLFLRRFMNSPKGPVFLVASIIALFFIHPPTFIIVSIIALIYHFFQIVPGKVEKSRRLFPVISICCICAIYVFGYFWAPSYITFNIKEAMIPQSEQVLPPIMDVVSKFGYIPPFLFAVGIAILAYKGTRKNWAMILPATGLFVFQMVYTFFTIGPDIIYERGWLYLYVLMAIIGGSALGEIRQWLKGILKHRGALAKIVSFSTVAVLIASSFIFSLRSYFIEPYYHLVDDAAYYEFLWIDQSVPPVYHTGITDIGIACPFAAVSGKYVFIGEVSRYFHQKEPLVEKFFKNRAADTGWLIKEGINMVYTNEKVVNSDLNKVSRNLYLLSNDP